MKHGLDWQQIHSVFLDMDGTLLDLHFDNHFWQEFIPQRYAEQRGLAKEEANQILVPKFKAQEGTLNWYCLDYWSEQLEMDVASLKEEVAHLINIREGVNEFLHTLQKTDKRVVLMTNAHRAVVKLKMKYTGLDSHFAAIVTSHEIGYPKEDPKFWRALQPIEPYDAAHTLFIDDSYNVLRSAKKAGIKYLLTIAQPSSQLEPRYTDEFEVLSNFKDIMPPLA
ncbi:MAG: GMP/IMP nucleotidase [Gammaproteobacteria bacterium]|nr:GMP/IMP nucleotidase [Gammaproteobacteria bacterium]